MNNYQIGTYESESTGLCSLVCKFVDETIECSAIFDHDEKILPAVLEKLESTGGLSGTGKNLSFRMVDGKAGMKLRKFIYCISQDISPDAVANKKIRALQKYADEDHKLLDFRSSNLYITDDLTMVSDSRAIEVGEFINSKYIRVTHSGHTEYLSYSDGLLWILATPSITSYYFDRNCNCLVVQSNFNPKLKVRAYRLAAFYYHGMLTLNRGPEALWESIQQACNTVSRLGLEVDHLSCDKRNNTRGNLSFMPKSANSSKSNLFLRINPEEYQIFGAVLHNGNSYSSSYMIQLNNRPTGDVHQYFCKDYNCLLALCNSLFRGKDGFIVNQSGGRYLPVIGNDQARQHAQQAERSVPSVEEQLIMASDFMRHWEVRNVLQGSRFTQDVNRRQFTQIIREYLAQMYTRLI